MINFKKQIAGFEAIKQTKVKCFASLSYLGLTYKKVLLKYLQREEKHTLTNFF